MYTWQSVALSRDTVLTLLAAIKVHKLKIDPDDYQNLKNAFMYMVEEEHLRKNRVSKVEVPEGCETLPTNFD